MQLPQQKIRDSFMSFVGLVRPPRVPEMTVNLGALRTGMVELLGTSGTAQSPQLMRDIRLASSREELWNLREALMRALSQQNGEVKARESLGRIDKLFGGTLNSRRSRRPT
jgi:hypothetical protein